MEEIKATISGEAEVSAAFIEPTANSGGSYVLPPATSTTLGGVKADPKTASDTQPVRIGSDGKLYTATGGGGGSATDVQINGTSITENGVANIPVASSSEYGAVKVSATYGMFVGADGILKNSNATESEISSRNGSYKGISPSTLNYAVTAVLTDGKAPALTEEQKKAAQDWLGVSDLIGGVEELIAAISEVVG